MSTAISPSIMKLIDSLVESARVETEAQVFRIKEDLFLAGEQNERLTAATHEVVNGRETPPPSRPKLM